MTRRFDALTEVGRARRLRPLARAALARYGLGDARLRLITNSWNCVFRVDASDGRRYALRIGLPRPERRPDVVRSEAAFMAAVADGTDVVVPVPVPDDDGALVTVAAADGVPEPRECVLFTWVTGVDLADRVSVENYRRLGVVAATMHRFARTWAPPDDFDIVVYDRTIHMGEPNVLTSTRAREHMTPEHADAVTDVVARLDEHVARAHVKGPVVVTHGDLHHWNVLIDRGRLRVIDFEDLQWAAPVLDVSTTLYYVRWRDDYPDLLAAYRSGYESVEPWVETFDGELDPLIGARAIDLLNVCIDEPELDVDLRGLSERTMTRVLDLLA